MYVICMLTFSNSIIGIGEKMINCVDGNLNGCNVEVHWRRPRGAWVGSPHQRLAQLTHPSAGDHSHHDLRDLDDSQLLRENLQRSWLLLPWEG